MPIDPSNQYRQRRNMRYCPYTPLANNSNTTFSRNTASGSRIPARMPRTVHRTSTNYSLPPFMEDTLKRSNSSPRISDFSSANPTEQEVATHRTIGTVHPMYHTRTVRYVPSVAYSHTHSLSPITENTSSSSLTQTNSTSSSSTVDFIFDFLYNRNFPEIPTHNSMTSFAVYNIDSPLHQLQALPQHPVQLSSKLSSPPLSAYYGEATSPERNNPVGYLTIEASSGRQSRRITVSASDAEGISRLRAQFFVLRALERERMGRSQRSAPLVKDELP